MLFPIGTILNKDNIKSNTRIMQSKSDSAQVWVQHLAECGSTFHFHFFFCGFKPHLIPLTDSVSGPSYTALQIKRREKKRGGGGKEESYPTFPWLSARLSSHDLQTTCTDPAHSLGVGGQKISSR